MKLTEENKLLIGIAVVTVVGLVLELVIFLSFLGV